MEFIFFSANDERLFVRNDAESATFTHEEMSLQALFPFVGKKFIDRGMRIGFTDARGKFQAFEIRKVRTYEPDHYQEITAEHIVISELSDAHIDEIEVTDDTAQGTLLNVLGYQNMQSTDPMKWRLGTDTSSGDIQTANISRGDVWQAVRVIEENWNVYITPRITTDADGITGRYLDIAPAGGTWRGVRLSLDKNADEIGVTWDDTNLITAIYGYGARVGDGEDTKVLTLEGYGWPAAADHPAKLSNMAYIENEAARLAYGRDGHHRYGYYQNSDIDDPEILCQKAWEALKQNSVPQVSIDCQVRDLYRLGYADQPLALHDTALIEIRQTGELLAREIIRLTENLLDPTATQVNIGAYIPNIIYMQRDTGQAARGGGGGGRRGSGSGLNGTGNEEDNRVYEFNTQIQANEYQINLRAYQRDMTNVESILKEAGVAIDASGVIIYAGNNLTEMKSSIQTNAGHIALVVDSTGSSASIKIDAIVDGINNSGSSITISADKIYLNGSTTIDNLLTGRTAISTLWATNANLGYVNILPRGDIDVTDGTLYTGSSFYVNGSLATWQSKTVYTSVNVQFPTVYLGYQHYYLAADNSGMDVTSKTLGYLVTRITDGNFTWATETIHYLGSAST